MIAPIAKITGVCPVLSAVFSDDGNVDLEGFRSLCRYVVNSGVRSLMVFGVATENSKLNDDERSGMLEVLVQEREGTGVSIVATVADHSTELATARARTWIAMGADAINILPSYFLSPAREEVLTHLGAILDSVLVPVIIQSLPSGGLEVPLSDIVALHQNHRNLSQVKVENTPAADLVRFVEQLSEGRVSALVGWGGLEWQEASDAGAVGVQPGCSLIELYLGAQTHLDSDDDAAFADSFAPLRAPLTVWMRHPEVLIAVEKHILRQRGIIPSSRTRHPSARLTVEDYALAEQALELLPNRGVTRA
jgi:dihydrodipicolinate synthase/N-acetylneuraminate lyase